MLCCKFLLLKCWLKEFWSVQDISQGIGNHNNRPYIQWCCCARKLNALLKISHPFIKKKKKKKVLILKPQSSFTTSSKIKEKKFTMSLYWNMAVSVTRNTIDVTCIKKKNPMKDRNSSFNLYLLQHNNKLKLKYGHHRRQRITHWKFLLFLEL